MSSWDADMNDKITDEFYRCDNPVDPRDDSFEPLNGRPAAHLAHPHTLPTSSLKTDPGRFRNSLLRRTNSRLRLRLRIRDRQHRRRIGPSRPCGYKTSRERAIQGRPQAVLTLATVPLALNQPQRCGAMARFSLEARDARIATADPLPA